MREPCSVCGKRHDSKRCDPRVLRGIDAANTRALHEVECAFSDPMRRPVAERIEAGAEILFEDESTETRNWMAMEPLQQAPRGEVLKPTKRRRHIR